jgi:hypothetical protein
MPSRNDRGSERIEADRESPQEPLIDRQLEPATCSNNGVTGPRVTPTGPYQPDAVGFIQDERSADAIRALDATSARRRPHLRELCPGT